MLTHSAFFFAEYMWELTEKTEKHRLLEVQLTKKSIMEGMIIWWDRVFKDDPKIDVKKITGLLVLMLVEVLRVTVIFSWFFIFIPF